MKIQAQLLYMAGKYVCTENFIGFSDGTVDIWLWAVDATRLSSLEHFMLPVGLYTSTDVDCADFFFYWVNFSLSSALQIKCALIEINNIKCQILNIIKY